MAKKSRVYHLREIEKYYGYSQAVRTGNTLYVSGTVSIDDEGHVIDALDMASQVRNVYDDIGITLKAHGITFEHVIKEVIYTTDMAALLRVDPIRKQYYENCDYPASSWVEVARLVNPDLVVEVEVIAEIPKSEVTF